MRSTLFRPPVHAGMTLKFFALFFMQACQVSPMVVSLLGALSPLGISAASMLSQRVSRMLGRVQVRLHMSPILFQAPPGL